MSYHSRKVVKSCQSKWREAAQMQMEGKHTHEDEASRRQYAYWLRQMRTNYPMSLFMVDWC